MTKPMDPTTKIINALGDLTWLLDPELPIIIDDDTWREKQRQVLGLPKWSRTPTPAVEAVFKWCRMSMDERAAAKQMTIPIDDSDTLDELIAHLQVDAVAFLWHFCWYRNRDENSRDIATPTPGQLVILWRFQRQVDLNLPVRLDLLKVRQGGFSWLFCNLSGWVIFFHKFIDGILVAQDRTTSGRMFRYLRDAFELLPTHLQPKKQHTTRWELLLRDGDSDTTDLGQESSLSVQTAGQDFVGTGQPLQLLHASEVGKWDEVCDTEVVYTSVVNAIQFKPWTFIFRESTAFGADTFWHKEWRRSRKIGKAGHNGFTPIFLPWYFDARNVATPPKGLEATLFSAHDSEFGNEVNLRKRYGLTLDQLEWRRAKIKSQVGDNPVGMQSQEHPDNDLDAWRFAGGKWFDVEDMEQLIARTQHEQREGLLRAVFVGDLHTRRELGTTTMKPLSSDGDDRFANVHLTRRTAGALVVYRWPDPTQDYVAGSDVAEGLVGGDASCIKIYQRVGYAHEGFRTLRLVAEWFGRADDWLVAEILWRLGWFYSTGYGTTRTPCLLAWERTGAGRNVARNLLMGPRGEAADDAYPLYRLYRRQDAATVKRRPEGQYGIATSASSKGGMLREWKTHAKVGDIQVNAEDIKEISTLTSDNTGRVDTQGRDRFMAAVMAVTAASSTPVIMAEGTLLRQKALPNTGAWLTEKARERSEGAEFGDEFVETELS